jgi:hypothetical protein
MKTSSKLAYLDELIEEITIDANGVDEQLWAFRQAIEDHVPVPCEATVAGAPVQVLGFDYDGNTLRGLTAVCLGPDGRKHTVSASDVLIPESVESGRYLAAYRKWIGIAPFPSGVRRVPPSKTAAARSKVEAPMELVVLSVEQRTARCRLLESDEIVSIRGARLRDFVPGEIAVIRPAKRSTYAGNPCLSGEIVSTRLEVKALGLVPLRLEEMGIWNPAEHYWGEEGESIDAWAKPIIAHGPRPQFEMERILPGADSQDLYSDPINDANDRRDAGDKEGARKILMDLCQADLRCLDAHAHLGNMVFDDRPGDAIRHYEAGFRIGELSLGERLDVLPWDLIDNRPFLRCMHGFGLCQWRLGRFKEAAAIFKRMLWLNPSDNQGVRFIIDEVRAKSPWRPD